ncbi:MAG: ribosome biogenesis GTP-binding protein YihA/YsxC [Clostridia bacterium]
MQITNAKFLISVADGKNLPEYNLPEIAIAGKSNVGKSSFINYMTNIGRLARTSADPGRTRLLNYFEINKGQFIFVDLPGYGYAKVSKSEQQKWGPMIESYLHTSAHLKHIFVLVDIRHDPTNDDLQLINYLFHYDIPFSIIATKADKLSRLQQTKARQNIASIVGFGVDNIFIVSSTNKSGKEAILDRISQILDVHD